MISMLVQTPATTPPASGSFHMDSVLETLIHGGPVMIPLGLSSVIALAWTIERFVRLRQAALGNRAFEESLLSTARDAGPARALELARSSRKALGTVFEPVFKRWNETRPTLEKAAEDAGAREVRTLVASLRPLTVIAVIAPLLGLLGTVIGIIIAFRDIALSNAMGKPEALSAGIAQALVTTATGLVIAIPTQAAYFWLRAKIDRFGRRIERFGENLLELHGQPPRHDSSASVRPPSPEPGVPAGLVAAAAGSS